MANSSLTLSSLDFDSLKNNFKEFLKTQSVFKDYDFNGSNMNVLLDVMSYNSYLNAFYLNMVASEMFLDSAQKYDSVVSHAKELNYVPRSAKSSIAEVNLTITANSPTNKIIIPKGTKFSGVNSEGTYTFITNETKILVSSNNTYVANNLQIFEGISLNESFVVDYDIESQKFVLSNENIDTNSLEVRVIENNGSTETIFNRVDTLFGVDEESNIYFLQAAQDDKFEIVFGDGLFGRKPLNGAVIQVSYRITQGTNGNGVTEFAITEDLDTINQTNVSIDDLFVVTPSSSGANLESIDSIRFAAPRYFATQQRAISSDDYASLVISKFSGQISDVIIYGGQELEPKLYGRVVVCLKPSFGTVAPDYLKAKILNYLLPYIAIPNRIVISDPEYLYCSIDSKVQYDNIIGEKSQSEIASLVLASIANYSSDNLEKFGKELRYSRLVSLIDNSDVNIVSNDTELRIIKRISPLLKSKTSYKLDINNKIYVEKNDGKTGIDYETRYTYASLISSKFTFVYNGISYPLCFFEDDNKGNINVNTVLNKEIVTIAKVGTIDYETGLLIIDDVYISDYDSHISLYLKPYNKDIFADKNKIILIDLNDVNVKISEVLG